MSAVMKSRGFTLFELIMIMVIVGVLAVAVVPRFFDQNAFLDKGFADELTAALRYAQKAAVAQRRTVCVTFADTSATLSISASAGGTCVNGALDSNSLALVSPTGASQFKVVAKGKGKLSPLPGDMKFNPLGQPLDSSGALIAPPGRSIAVVDSAGGPVAQLTVEAETGYVH